MFRSVACFSHSPCLALHNAALSSGSIPRRGVWTNVGWKQCCRIDWFGVERLHVHDLVRSYIISIVVVPPCSALFFVLSPWFGVEHLNGHDLVRSYIISACCTIRFLTVHLITLFLSCMIVQVPGRKESIPSCALPS